MINEPLSAQSSKKSSPSKLSKSAKPLKARTCFRISLAGCVSAVLFTAIISTLLCFTCTAEEPSADAALPEMPPQAQTERENGEQGRGERGNMPMPPQDNGGHGGKPADGSPPRANEPNAVENIQQNPDTSADVSASAEPASQNTNANDKTATAAENTPQKNGANTEDGAVPKNNDANDNSISENDSNGDELRGRDDMRQNFPPNGDGNGDPINFNQNENSEDAHGFVRFVKTYFTPIVSMLLLILAFVFVIYYR